MGMMKDIYIAYLEKIHPPPEEPDDIDYEYSEYEGGEEGKDQ